MDVPLPLIPAFVLPVCVGVPAPVIGLFITLLDTLGDGEAGGP